MKLKNLLSLFLVIACNSLLLGSTGWQSSVEQAEAVQKALREFEAERQQAHDTKIRFNLAIQNAIDAWNPERSVSDDEVKRNNRMEDIINYLNGSRLRPILPDLFKKKNGASYDIDSVVKSIAHYHRMHNIPLGRGYELRRYEGQVRVSIKKIR